MTIGIWVLGDQFWSQQAALHSCQPSTTELDKCGSKLLTGIKQPRPAS